MNALLIYAALLLAQGPSEGAPSEGAAAPPLENAASAEPAADSETAEAPQEPSAEGETADLPEGEPVDAGSPLGDKLSDILSSGAIGLLLRGGIFKQGLEDLDGHVWEVFFMN